MTLVAAFRSYKTPCLVGDFLITTIGNKESQRKKLRILDDRLAIAWTGHLLAAQAAIEALQVQISQNHSIDRMTLESILTDSNFVELGALQVTLIGWVVEDTTEYCFRWNSGYPIEVFYGDPMFDGSGDFAAENLIGHVGIDSSDDGFTSNSDDVVAGVLSTVTNLMKAEVVGPSFRHNGFGFAYEAILLNQQRQFEYIGNVLYYALVHEISEEGYHLASRFIGKPIKVTDYGGNALISIFDPNKNEQTHHLITPVGLPIESDQNMLFAEVLSSNGPSPFSADYYYAFVLFDAPQFHSPPIVLSFDANKSPELVDLSNRNEFTLKINSAQIEWLYKSIKQDMNSSQE